MGNPGGYSQFGSDSGAYIRATGGTGGERGTLTSVHGTNGSGVVSPFSAEADIRGNSGGQPTKISSGGGGGGAGSVGKDTAGGQGYPSDISGLSVTYAVGGKGGNPIFGAANTGNGGGGGYNGNGGSGGSGIVIVRWPYIP